MEGCLDVQQPYWDHEEACAEMDIVGSQKNLVLMIFLSVTPVLFCLRLSIDAAGLLVNRGSGSSEKPLRSLEQEGFWEQVVCEGYLEFSQTSDFLPITSATSFS